MDLSICGVVSLSGYEGEPLACGFPANHGGAHAWASLPTPLRDNAPWYSLGYFDGWSDHKAGRAYGEAIARRRAGGTTDETCPTCGGRGWHTAGGNDPMTCSCPAGERYERGSDG